MEGVKKPILRFSGNDSGTVLVLTALALVALLGSAALAIDIGRIIVVRQELQNAADAGAMAGARHLIPYLSISPPLPDWNAAQAAAASATRANVTDGSLISDCQVQVGYWNLIYRELRPATISPSNVEVPAVSVRVAKAPGQNAGPVVTFLARVLGIDLVNLRAQATAMISCPSTMPPNSLFPVAINIDFVRRHFHDGTSFYIGSDYHYEDEEAGQWTSFFDVKNDTTTIRKLIYEGNPDPVRIGQLIQCLSDIWIQPGTKTALYKDVKTKIGETVWVPVVDIGFETHAWNPVLAYLPILIEDSVGGSQKYIKARFVAEVFFPSDDTGGPCYGGFSPPRIVQ